MTLSQLSTLVVLLLFAASTYLLDPLHAASYSDPVTHIPHYGPAKTTQYAGYLDVASKRGSLFHWFFEKEDSSGKQREIPIALWLNGGPGCSSTTGLLDEMGPFRFTGNGLDLTDFEHTWQKDAHMLFIDQPVGTGLSRAEAYVTDERQVAVDIHSALVEFFTLHPEYQANDFYLLGESYAGHYVPAIAMQILLENKNSQTKLKINLKGIGIGNGLIHPVQQRLIKADQIYNHQLVDYRQREVLQDLLLRCSAHIQNQDLYPEACDHYHHFFEVASGGINRYDLRRFTDSTNRTRREEYLNLPEVRDTLGISFEQKPEFRGCDSTVHSYLSRDVLKSMRYLLPALVESGIKVLLFAGNMDLKDSPIGMEQMLLSHPYFADELDFKNIRRDLWINPQSEVAGYVKQKDNFAFVVVHGAGHFVPTDQGSNARDLFRKFVYGIPFCSGEEVRLKFSHDETPFHKRAVGEQPPLATYQCDAIAGHLCRETTDSCSGHGSCSPAGFCECSDGWTGHHCGWNLTYVEKDGALMRDGLSTYSLNQHWHFVDTDLAGVLYGKMNVKHHYTDGKPDHPVATREYSPEYLEEKMVGEGVGHRQPWNKVCVYAKKGEQPSRHSFHFVHCLEKDETGTVFMTPFSNQEEWKFGIWNGLPHGVSIDFQLSLDAPPSGRQSEKKCSVLMRLACVFFMCDAAC